MQFPNIQRINQAQCGFKTSWMLLLAGFFSGSCKRGQIRVNRILGGGEQEDKYDLQGGKPWLRAGKANADSPFP